MFCRYYSSYGILSTILLIAIVSLFQISNELRHWLPTANLLVSDRYQNTNVNYNDISFRDALSGGNKPMLQVAWLMSFPNSGTTYTNHLIQDYTNTTTATNYGQEQSTTKTTIPVFANSTNGPFFRYPTWTLPPKFILTKTHCGGECDACQTPGSKEYNDTTPAFELACCSGKRIVSGGTKIRTSYPSDIPKRAVHLIRDPFDNVVARLHLKERRWARFEGKKNKSNDDDDQKKYEERLGLYNNTKAGFRAYCKFRDQRSLKQERRYRSLNSTLLQYIQEVPCYAEFVRYTKWHNHAIELLEKKGIPAITLFYENYGTHWNYTVSRLLHFLSLPPSVDGTAPEFVSGKEYSEFYTENEKLAVKKLLEILALPALFDLLQRYM